MKFTELSKKVTARFNELSQHKLFRMDVSKDELWNAYLDSFPAGTNEIYKERREYDCQCCAQFVKNIGGVVAIINGEIKTVWEIEVGGHFQVVCDAMNSLVSSSKIKNIFLHTEPKFGREKSTQTLESGESINWNHFHCELPRDLVQKEDCQSLLGKLRTNFGVFKRGLEEISIESCEIVLDLINQKSLYKGDEFKVAVASFKRMKTNYDNAGNKEVFIWENAKEQIALIKNSVIGTLLVDLSEGAPINNAVGSFESKVAPTNYKRSSAPITKAMVNKAMDKINSLGLESALDRRFATIEDISVNNVIFADRSSSALMKDGLAELLMSETKEPTKNYDKFDEVSIEDFIANVIPNIDSMEILVENNHTNNLVSLVSPKHEDSEKLFQWDNQFSWSYFGNITDSIKERVKRAGGNVSGVLRASLSWSNTDDLDIHVIEPDGKIIYHGSKRSYSSGRLDVDMNVDSLVTDPVENVVWTEKSKMRSGEYEIMIHNYTKRNSTDVGFELEIDFDGNSKIYSYPKSLKHKEKVLALSLSFYGSDFKIINVNKDIETSGKGKDVWGISTQKFQKVSTVMLSPNFWDDMTNGNKHYFFMLDGCVNPEDTRGIYNEFLRKDLAEHRKVLEILADKTKCESTSNQLSGLGFSSTKRASIVCKVNGNFTRTLKINF